MNGLYFADADPTGGIYNYLFTQGVLGVVCVGLILTVIYLVRRNDKKDDEIKGLNALLLSENKLHTTDYKQMADRDQEVLQLNSQTNAILAAKIENVKGSR